MDATAPELGVNCRATTNQVWRENASGDITHFPFFAFQTQRKGSSRMWARVYKRLILRRPCTHPKTTLRSICKSKKKKLYLLWFKRNRNQTEFKLHSLEDNKNVTVMTDITGLSVYTYSQSYASGYVSGNAISFNSTGKIKATITQVVGFNLSYVINSSGTYDKSAGKGSVTVSAY